MKMILRTSVFAVLMSGVAGGAMAQTSDERIAALEAKILGLTGELAEIKAASTRPVAPSPNQLALDKGRPTIATADGSQKFAIRVVGQFDAASYDERQGPTDLNSGTNWRRARLGAEGTFAKDWSYNLTGEFGGSGAEAPQLIQANLEYTGWQPVKGATVRLRVGGWATPTGLEDATSNTEALFLERPAVAEMVRGLAGGDARSGVGVLANGERWYASAVLTGAVVGAPQAAEFDEQLGYLTRIAFAPVSAKTHAIHVGATMQGVLRPADTGAGAARVTQIKLRERAELRVDGVRLVDTGSLNADGATAYGLELGAFYRNLQVSAEAFRIDVDRPGAFNPGFGGWYVQGAWTITGESHVWHAANGGFKGIKPAKPFNLAAGAWGAWEIAGRYSVLDLNDRAGVAGAATPAGGVRGGEQRIATVGVNWHPNAVFRFQMQLQRIDVDRLNAAGARIGDRANALSLRSQFAF